MRLFKKLRGKLNYLDPEQVERIHQAYLLALAAHEGQKRHTGEPYITHPVAVACILAEMKLDSQTIMAALLHDVIEDTPIEKETLVEQFGETVAELVDGVSKLAQIEFGSRAEAQAENFRKMVLAMARDIRVIIIKLADRLHNMRTLIKLPSEKRIRIARETLEIFAPIAKRLGMHDLSVELEELGFMTRYPRRYSILHKAIAEARGERKKVLNLVNKTLHEGLEKDHFPACTISGRGKHLYSIYRKMRHKRLPFSEIMDVYAFRIIVDNIDTCYRVLGLVHRLFKPVPEKFKDYIAIPKANGYQSLHTVVFGPYGYPIEMQIRTTEMEYHATSGIASHWLYKTGGKRADSAQIRAQQWVKNLMELQRDTGSSLEFIESVKLDLFPDEVYVFTPRGQIMRLPAGSTVVDFAYAVHTDIGRHCIAAKVDRQIAPLSSRLDSGETVEIITDSRSQPNPAWLDFVVTRQARNSIRQFLKDKLKGESVSLGERLLKQALKSYKSSLRKVPNDVINFVLQDMKLENMTELFHDIGLGNRPAHLVAQRLIGAMTSSEKMEANELKMERQVPLLVKGTEGMVLNFSECCYPIPGDPIIGLLSSGEGVIVHAEQCHRLEKLRRRPDVFMNLRWDQAVSEVFPVIICVDAIDEPRLLAKLAMYVADAEASIVDIRVQSRGGSYYQFIFKLLVRDRVHLAQVMRNLRRLPAVTGITRGLKGEIS